MQCQIKRCDKGHWTMQNLYCLIKREKDVLFPTLTQDTSKSYEVSQSKHISDI